MGVEEIRNIKTHCRNLRRVCIYGLERYNAEISDLLASYRNQLTFCRVENMSESELLHLTRACKNARFCARVTEAHALLPSLGALGDKIESARVDFRGRDYGDWRALANAWNGCCNMREVTFFSCDGEDARALMAGPKPLLRILNLFLLSYPHDSDGRRISEMMDSFSNGNNKSSPQLLRQ